jgi:DNA repair protein RecO (recombination protein O)
MKTIVTKGVVLSRTDYGEADRILHFLTPDHGKISAIAKGVRRSKSKLAGGIELFSISDLSFIVGKSEIYTIISARLDTHYGNIVKELERTNTGYDFLRLINKSTEDNADSEYFELIKQGLEALDDLSLNPDITALWFRAQLVKMSGHTPNLKTDCNGNKLTESSFYRFDLDNMCFDSDKSGRGEFSASHIKFMRLSFAAIKPQILHQVKDIKEISGDISPLIQSMIKI